MILFCSILIWLEKSVWILSKIFIFTFVNSTSELMSFRTIPRSFLTSESVLFVRNNAAMASLLSNKLSRKLRCISCKIDKFSKISSPSFLSNTTERRKSRVCFAMLSSISASFSTRNSKILEIKSKPSSKFLGLASTRC